MPTGLTYKLMDEGQSLEEFALVCSRHMGVLYYLLGDDTKTPIPEAFDDPDDYYEALRDAKVHLQALLALDEGERQAKGEELRAARITHLEETLSVSKEPFEYPMQALAEARLQSPTDFFEREVAGAKVRVASTEDSWKTKCAQVDRANTYLRDLRRSIGS